MTTNTTSKRKALLALKQRLIGEIQLTDKRIKEVCRSRTQATFVEDEGSDSENESDLTFGNNLKQLRAEQQMLRTCLHATQELTGLQILQSEVNVMIKEPEILGELPVEADGVWREVMAECVVDRVPFIIIFYAHQANYTFTPIWYRGLKVTPLKSAQKDELDKSILSALTSPADAIETLKNYAAAHWSRRTTLARLADKFQDMLFMEVDPDGGFSLRCAELLHIRWTLQNERSPLAPFQHKFKCDLEHMDPSYIKIIKQAYKQLSYDVGTDDRTHLLAKIVTTCLEAQGPTKKLYESMSSDPEMAIEIKRRRTTLDEQPAPAKKRRASADVMAPPKSPLKKAKGNKENLPDSRKSLKRSLTDKDARNAKKVKSSEEMVSKMNSVKTEECSSKIVKIQHKKITEKAHKDNAFVSKKPLKRPLNDNVAINTKSVEDIVKHENSEKCKESRSKADGNNDPKNIEKANRENNSESAITQLQSALYDEITSNKSNNKKITAVQDKNKTKSSDKNIPSGVSENKKSVSHESQMKKTKTALEDVPIAKPSKEPKNKTVTQDLRKKKSQIETAPKSDVDKNVNHNSEKIPDQLKPMKSSKKNIEVLNNDKVIIKSKTAKAVSENKDVARNKNVEHASEKTKQDVLKSIKTSNFMEKINSKAIESKTLMKEAETSLEKNVKVDNKQTSSKEINKQDLKANSKIALNVQKVSQKQIHHADSKSDPNPPAKKGDVDEKRKDPNIEKNVVNAKSTNKVNQTKKIEKVLYKKPVEKRSDKDTFENRKNVLKSKEKTADADKAINKNVSLRSSEKKLDRRSVILQKEKTENHEKKSNKNIYTKNINKPSSNGKNLTSKSQHNKDPSKTLLKVVSENTVAKTKSQHKNNPLTATTEKQKAVSDTNLQNTKAQNETGKQLTQKMSTKYFSETNLQKNKKVMTKIPVIGQVKPAHITNVNKILRPGNTTGDTTGNSSGGTLQKVSKIPQKKWSTFRSPVQALRMSPRTLSHMKAPSAILGQRLIHKPSKSNPRTSSHMKAPSAILGQRLIHKPSKSNPMLLKKLAPPPQRTGFLH